VQAFDGDMRISLEDSPGKKVSKIPTQRTSWKWLHMPIISATQVV
jgi:hypothetical protein